MASVAFTAIAAMTSMSYPGGAAAQPARVTPGGEDLRAAYANAADVADGKRVADSSCAKCHGTNGISVIKGVPHLAGQRPAYLYVELRAYRSGTRGDDAMKAAVRDLSDDALVKVSAYYASLDTARVGLAEGAKAPSAMPDPVQAGKTAAVPCGGCHGEGGAGKIPGMPSLAGLDPKYLVAAMKAYKSGQRRNEVMTAALAGATDTDINNIALYYALQKPVRTENPVAGDRPAGKEAAAACGVPRRAGGQRDPRSRASPDRMRNISLSRSGITRTDRVAMNR